MADIRIKDLATTASSAASDDFMALDGTTNGTRKMSAANPSVTTLTTSGVITPGGSVHGANGSAANPSFAFNSDQNTGLYRIGADNIGVTVGGVKALDISSTGVTATTTLADQGGTIAAQRNGLAPRQGLAFDGTLGSTLTNLSAFGTADFSVCLVGVQLTASTGYFLGAPANGLEIYVVSGATLAFDVRNLGTMAISAGFGNTTTPFNLTVTRSSGVLRAYRDGIEFTLTAGAISQATNISAASTRLGISGVDTFPFTGALRPVGIYNRALSAAEVLALYQSGAVASADYTGTGAGTTLNTTAFVEESGLGFDSFSGSSSSGFTAGVTTTSGTRIIQSRAAFAVKKGDTIKFTFTATQNSGTIGAIYPVLRTASGSTISAIGANIAAGSNTYNLAATSAASDATVSFIRGNGGSVVNFTIASFTATPIGALLAPDSNNAGAGLEWLDVSGNRAHIILPTSGVSWSLPSSQQIVIEASTSTNGNQQLGGASLIDANKQWRIQSWTVNCSTGTPTISLGNVSAGTQYNAAAVLAAGNNDITLVTRFPSTANLWVNSSTTATLIHRIVLAPAN